MDLIQNINTLHKQKIKISIQSESLKIISQHYDGMVRTKSSYLNKISYFANDDFSLFSMKCCLKNFRGSTNAL